MTSPAEWKGIHKKQLLPIHADRTFTVTGPLPVGGKKKGETVTLYITPDQADALIEAGHVVEQSPAMAEEIQADEIPAKPRARSAQNKKGS